MVEREPPAAPPSASPSDGPAPAPRARRRTAGKEHTGDATTAAAPRQRSARASPGADVPATTAATSDDGKRRTSARRSPTTRNKTPTAQPTDPDPPAPASTHDGAAAAGFVPSFARTTTVLATRSATMPAPLASAQALRMIDWLCEWLPPARRRDGRELLVLLGMARPLGALLLLWPTLWALWLAALDFPPAGWLLAAVPGVFLVHATASVIDDLLERRWPSRPTVAPPRVAARTAAWLALALLAVAGALLLALAPLARWAVLAGVAGALLARLARRRATLAGALLALARSAPVVVAFALIKPALPPLCWLLFTASMLFALLQDLQLALARRAEDAGSGTRSLADVLGDADRVAGAVLVASLVLALVLTGLRATLHWPWFVGVLAATALLARGWWQMRERTPAACLAAWRSNNRVGFVLWFGLLFALALR